VKKSVKQDHPPPGLSSVLDGGNYCASTHRMCAERRQLCRTLDEARKRGVRPSNVTAWIHRKNKGVMTVLRSRADGTFGCSVPCVYCRREMLRYNLRVQCFTSDGDLFCGPLDDAGAPRSKLTSGQTRNAKK